MLGCYRQQIRIKISLEKTFSQSGAASAASTSASQAMLGLGPMQKDNTADAASRAPVREVRQVEADLVAQQFVIRTLEALVSPTRLVLPLLTL